MLRITLISVGALKEEYFRQAAAEYEKRLSGLCQFKNISLKEEKIKNEESPAEIAAALDREGERILAVLPSRSHKIALCIEGEQYTSEALARQLERAGAAASEICFVIGSSHGLADKVKRACDATLSLSKLTFPHRLARVILLEALYRALSILAGGKYHK